MSQPTRRAVLTAAAVLLVTLGLAIAMENGLLVLFGADTRSLDAGDAFEIVAVGPMLLSQPRLIGFAVAVLVAALLWALLALTDTGRAIRAVAREDLGARLVGILSGGEQQMLA